MTPYKDITRIYSKYYQARLTLINMPYLCVLHTTDENDYRIDLIYFRICTLILPALRPQVLVLTCDL